MKGELLNRWDQNLVNNRENVVLSLFSLGTVLSATLKSREYMGNNNRTVDVGEERKVRL